MPACFRSALLPLLLAAPAATTLAQQAVRQRPVVATREPEANAALPIRRVALYKNGVGFFEHVGTVRGNQAVTIDFTTGQLNDVLQTLTAVDLGGGRIGGAGYNSTTPLDQQLKSLPLSISADPTAADFYTAIRGARVEVTGSGATITGRLLNVELRDSAVPKKDGDDGAVAQRHFLTVVSDAGAVRTLELTGNTSVRLLDPALHSDVNRYLQILAANHQDGLRHLTLTDSGSAAPRELRVSYISEVPIWKCTYRLLFDNNGAATPGTKTATLQGWAVIDNTVGSDWNNVQLSLIAGAPQSFLQPISQPYYSRRPEIGLPQEAQLSPQTHESGEDKAAVATGSGAGVGYGSGDSRLASGVNGGATSAEFGNVTSAATADALKKSLPINGRTRVYNGIANGSFSSGRSNASVNVEAAPALIGYEEVASQSIAPQTTTNSFDDYFEYKLTDPVTIRKNESALVPILQTKVEVDPVTLWSPNGSQPLRALWIKNTSALTLDRGSFSILENGNFSGQGLVDPVHPGERRLLSYAADQAVRVSRENGRGNSRRVQQITLAKGVLIQKTAEVTELTYLVHNAAPEPRTVVVEQPKRPGFTLDSDPKPEETTANAYRFRVVTQPGETVRLHIGERRTFDARYQLANIGEDQLTLILREDGNPAAVLAALQPVIETKRRLAALDNQIAQRNAEVNTIGTDQRRLRENLQALKGSAEERALTKRYTDELNAQEDRLAVLKTEIAGLRQQQEAAQQALAAQIEVLQLEATL